jgi:leucine dehydrogenase
MEESLFRPLREEGLTTLRISHHWKSGRISVRAAREWEPETDWSRYRKDFTWDDPLTSDAVCLGDSETRELFRRHGLAGYLEEVVRLVVGARHQGVEAFLDAKRSIHFLVNMHSNTLGIGNGRHAVRAGGIRRHDPGTRELDVLVDGLNLARAMSFKNAAAGMPFGGSKITVQCPPVDLEDLSTVGFLAYGLDRSRSVTGPDMGFTPSLSDVMHEHGYSHNITGGLKNRLGPTGTPTAYGIYVALKAALAFRYGSDSLAGKTIVVQGLGAVGRPLVEENLLQEDVTVWCSDVNPEAVEQLVRRHPGKVRALASADVLTWEADVFLPCAVGGILDEDAIRGLRYAVVLGAANNQLKATTPEEEMRLARLLAERGILFQTDWIQNAGGVIAGMEEYLKGEEASPESIRAQVERACGLGTLENLTAAKREGITPTEMAYRRYSEMIYR